MKKLLGYLFLFSSATVYITSPILAEAELTDIEGNVFEENIRNLVEDNIVSGYSDNTFRPNENVTRGELAVFIVRAFNLEIDTTGDPFPDVTPENKFFPYIQTLKNLNIVVGYSDGKYKPDEFVTRGTVSKYIIAAYNPDFDSSKTYLHGFLDIVGNRFEPYIAYLSSLESNGTRVVSGYSDGTYRPETNITRGQMSKFVDLSRNATETILVDASSLCEEKGGAWIENSKQCNGIEESVCSEMGGEYDSCGSPCGRYFEGYCILVCVDACYF